jgi:hypothetical protein
MGNRMSSLPIAQFCGMAPRLSPESGAGRPAAVSSAFHALCANTEDAPKLFALLTLEEQRDMLSWQRPSTIVLEDPSGPVVLDYASAEKELTLALDAEGNAVDEHDPSAITVGHMDFGWVREVGGHRVAYVADLKKSAFTATDGPDSLQLIAYGFAYAALRGCSHFACGIFVLETGEWTWGGMVDLYDLQTALHWQRVRHAALNESTEYATGAHCRGCWQRTVCKAHTLRGLEGTALAGLSTGITRDNALDMLLMLQAAKDLVEKGTENLKEWARQNGGITNEDGTKVYKPVPTKGRKGFDAERFQIEHPDLAKQYETRGKGTAQFRWVKA